MPVADLIAELAALHRELREAAAHRTVLEAVHPKHRASAANLLSYLALRRRDLRPLQEQLARYGLSSLGRAEPHVLSTLSVVLRALHAIARTEGLDPGQLPDSPPGEWDAGPARLREHAAEVLGPVPAGRSARIMVTMPSAAAENPLLVRELLKRGMDCMRINCAHDGPEAWLRMIENLRQVECEQDRECRIDMDLSGPKLRTGPLTPLPGVVKVRPHRDEFGRVIGLARVRLGREPSAAKLPGSDAWLPIVSDAWPPMQAGDSLHFRDARGAVRRLEVTEVDSHGCWAEARRTCYFTAGMELRVQGHGATQVPLVIGKLAERPSELLLKPGDRLVLTRNLTPGGPAVVGADGRVVAPARIGCTLGEALDHLQPGQRVLFDDGRISAVTRDVQRDEAIVEIVRTRPGGGKLRSDKGINLPDTLLEISPLTDKDLADLPLVCRHADMVALSFANSPADVHRLIDAIEQIGADRPGIITRRGFESLPAMLLAVMRSPRCGVMIARGDLAVECGFERLAEMQEEILWICEAAHVPVIWATQVLESLAKEGLPSRAEVTDAAMGDRAECVMLNKGPHIGRAVQTLDDILRRMHSHHSKKRSMLRGLRMAELYFEDHADESLADRG
ncbi:MAG: pyruvate kinase [Pirellulaceae bacterium]|nr:pyruvate kinase [Pirellulaceae bacterium]